MNYQEVMNELRKMGNARKAKIYRRHGAGDNVYGVSFADLNRLKKEIIRNHNLALRLWNSGNTDAMTLATMVVDPQKMTAAEADKWIGNISYYLLADLCSAVIAKTQFAEKKMVQWMKSKKEFTIQCGYDILASLLKNGADISDSKCREYLKTIEKDIHSSPNRARHAMNNALIAIGIYKPKLTKETIDTAKRTGKVEVDHGETSCKTPDAVEYIERALKRVKKN